MTFQMAAQATERWADDCIIAAWRLLKVG